jgi:hypothetical protein
MLACITAILSCNVMSLSSITVHYPILLSSYHNVLRSVFRFFRIVVRLEWRTTETIAELHTSNYGFRL